MAGLRVSLLIIAALMAVAAAGCTPQHQEGSKAFIMRSRKGKEKAVQQ
ncbi:hypothetical protein PO124_08400 [Bacillus licheniformis]|nr:hypothetical protein [Bacillus licheniformis]